MNDTCKNCGQPIHWVLHLGLWYHDTPTSVLACPAEIVEPAEILLGALTPRELSDLAHKLSDGSHAAYNVAHTLSYAAGLFPIGTPEEERIWNARRQWETLANELADLAAECRSARAALSVRMAADA